MTIDRARKITVVSGLPRSGTSMMMSMLEAGGMPLVVDELRTADEDNPRGYFEFEQVKKLKADASWLAGAQGKAVKIISELLLDLPESHEYRVLFMRRNLDEILASQKKMLVRRGTDTPDVSDDEMRAMFFEHLEQVMGWLEGRANFAVKYVSYNRVLERPKEQAEAIADFLGGGLDVRAMLSVIDKALHRNRSGD